MGDNGEVNAWKELNSWVYQQLEIDSHFLKSAVDWERCDFQTTKEFSLHEKDFFVL